MYQRGKIQEESLHYEHQKHNGGLPLIGGNTFLPREHAGDIVTKIELILVNSNREASADPERVGPPAARTAHLQEVADPALIVLTPPPTCPSPKTAA